MRTHSASSHRGDRTTQLGTYETGSLLSPDRRARLAARMRKSALDRALARGADPDASPALAARAAALTTAANRRALADALELVVRRAQGPPSHHRLVPSRAGISASAPALAELAALVRADVPLYARGLAMLEQLVTDGTGPLYARGDATGLVTALGDARDALAGGQRATADAGR